MVVTHFPSRAAGVADRMSGFIAHLRLNGLKLGPGETGEALTALTQVSATDVQEVRLALKTLLVPDADTWSTFDALFDAYWFNAGKTRSGTASTHVRTQSARPTLWQPHLNGAGADTEGQNETTPSHGDGDAEGVDGRLIATRSANLRKRDLRELMDEETLREAEAAARRLAQAIRDRRSRRRKRSQRGALLDLRRIQRTSLARGGELLDLHYRKRPDRSMRIVAIADVSGSMTVYSRVFLAFIKGLIDTDTSADAYLFHTRLMRITPALRDHDTLRAAGRLSLMAEGFGGGTDIGGCLANFVKNHAAKAVNNRTVVLVLSDGYCTGTPEALADSLSKIRRKARRVVWLNPLLGWKDYAPVNAGITAALPHIDAHLPANTLDALAALEPQFAKL
ncbi:vWA domain-containing protein [Shimia abyssi]|uniref:Uncharacterized protein with von Willebrand factor type A (VWA) domain n=1 Tax=Shimia abyssi TaxID=1662395 RepID=A0A2P8FHF9_9RHOB|nr:VWA domain-containing protein [Shimia abyssi]PSL21125.1 uncharacterized protein with von Willebrand factor type A (vWA) domain [Shimia abyssi]